MYGCARPRRQGSQERPRLLETARDLIAQGADPDYFDPNRSGELNISPLHEALRGLRDLDSEMVKLLLGHGARTTFVYANGWQETALDVAKRTLPRQFVPRMAAILRPFEEAHAKDAVACDILRPFEEARTKDAAACDHHQRIRELLLAALAGPLRESFWIALAPKLHYPLPLTPRSSDDLVEVDVVIPHLAAWDRFLFPRDPGRGPTSLVPTWVCEMEDDTTEDKLTLHARAGVRRVWRIDPVARTVAIYALGPGARLQEIAVHGNEPVWHLPPFEAVSIDTTPLWET